MTDEIFYRVVDLPPGIHSLVRKSPDGSYTILVSESDCPERQLKAIEHEKDHIEHGDLDSEIKVQEIEMEAHGIMPRERVLDRSAIRKSLERIKRRRKKLQNALLELEEIQKEFCLVLREESWNGDII